MTSFHVICGLGLSQSKILGTLMNWRSPEKNFWELFFWRTLAPVSLASSIAVLDLERFCPRKGCPWPWPRIFFVSLALASSLVSSTPPLRITLRILLLVLGKHVAQKHNNTFKIGNSDCDCDISITILLNMGNRLSSQCKGSWPGASDRVKI